jgi:hypothetical protein
MVRAVKNNAEPMTSTNGPMRIGPAKDSNEVTSHVTMARMNVAIQKSACTMNTATIIKMPMMTWTMKLMMLYSTKKTTSSISLNSLVLPKIWPEMA